MITTTSGGLLATAWESRAGQSKNAGFASPEEILPSVLVLTTPLRWPNDVRSAPSHSAKESPATYIRNGFAADTCRIARLPCAADGLVTTGGTGTGGPGTVGVGPGTTGVAVVGGTATRGELTADAVRVLSTVRVLAAVRVLDAPLVTEARGTVAAAALVVGEAAVVVRVAVLATFATVAAGGVLGATVGGVLLHPVNTTRRSSGKVSQRQRRDRALLE